MGHPLFRIPPIRVIVVAAAALVVVHGWAPASHSADSVPACLITLIQTAQSLPQPDLTADALTWTTIPVATDFVPRSLLQPLGRDVPTRQIAVLAGSNAAIFVQMLVL